MVFTVADGNQVNIPEPAERDVVQVVCIFIGLDMHVRATWK